MLKEGITAPAISAPDQSGRIRQLSDYQGRWILLYFYPKDDTPGCTTEACALRDNYAEFRKINAVILGVSADSAASHEKFAKKFDLPFPLLADENKKILKDYGVDGLVRRISYLIGPDGKITKAYPKVKPAEHAAEVLRDLASPSA
jgi:peroxiredoxin Q/BCP